MIATQALTMEWEEYVTLTRTLLDFYELGPEHQKAIMLMIDGLKYRKAQANGTGNTEGH